MGKGAALLMAAMMFISAGGNAVEADAAETSGQPESREDQIADPRKDSEKQNGYTLCIPPEYLEKPERRGEIVGVEYETRDYTDSGGNPITKPAYVYLPHGYDEDDTETRYDILYLMHGWTMTAESFFRERRGELANLLDNMIENGDIPPVIVVCATFDAQNRPQDFSRSVREIAAFHNDFRNDLVPYIESRFHTYAEGTDEEALRSSRAHRAFAGFSLGAVTTWYQFCRSLDYVKYFAPMSGDCWILGSFGGLYRPEATVEYLENVVRNGGWGEEDFFIWSGIGTNDPIWAQVVSQMEAMQRSGTFTAKNLRHAVKQGGYHDLAACGEYLYNALPVFFGARKAQ